MDNLINLVSIKRDIVTCSPINMEKPITYKGQCKYCPYHRDIRCPKK